MREASSEQSGETIPLLSLQYFVFVGQRMQTRLPVSVSHVFSTRNIDERIGAFADRELTVCSSHFAMVTPKSPFPTLSQFRRGYHYANMYRRAALCPVAFNLPRPTNVSKSLCAVRSETPVSCL